MSKILTYIPEDNEKAIAELKDKAEKDLTDEDKIMLAQYRNTLFISINFLLDAEDATPRASLVSKIKLALWVEMLIDRLRSRTRNKTTISLIITELFLQFMRCYSEHRRKSYYIYDMLMMAVETMSSEASQALMTFFETEAGDVVQNLKKQGKDKKENEGKKQVL